MITLPRLARLTGDKVAAWANTVCNDIEARLRQLLNTLSPVLTAYTAALTCSGSMTVTGGTCAAAYACVGDMVILTVQIDGVTLGGSASTEVRATLPFTAAAMGVTPAIITRYVVDGTYYMGAAVIAPSGTYVKLQAVNNGNWALGSMFVYFQIIYWK
jgi:hypothetical protein